MMCYIYEWEDWPRFRWNESRVARLLAPVRHNQGRLLGRMDMLGFDLRSQAILDTLTENVIKSSEIEGDRLDGGQVRSSIARRLGMDAGGLPPADRQVEGVVEMMLDATENHAAPLSPQRLFAWHAALFRTGFSGLRRIVGGRWRDDAKGPMQVVSGRPGRERVHFRAPDAQRLDAETAAFIAWFNAPPDCDSVVKAALAHLWFVTLHPFDDGNGRIARALADMALARAEGTSRRFYSMSAQIEQERNAYYDMLETTQKGGLDVTDWLEWFLGCLDRAFARADAGLSGVLRKARIWVALRDAPLNDRQRKVINRLLDGFDGNLTSSKWAALTKTSQDTALRDIADLVARGILRKNPGGGRSTSYSFAVRDR